jgi:threonine dehydrogenase-like Zn-dependent dehydrogenase
VTTVATQTGAGGEVMDRRLVFPQRRMVRLEPHRSPDPDPGQVRVASTLSLMSTGTESTVYTGDFAADGHFARYGTLPFHPGYLTVGVIDAVGAGVRALAEGDRVFHRAGHGSRFTLPETAVTPIPDQVGDDEAVWAGLAKIAYRAAYAAPFRLGGGLVILGAGPVGQMAIRWARSAGCAPIVVVARSPYRLGLAQRGGATHLVQADARDAAEAAATALGAAPGLVVDTTGNAAAFDGVLAMAGRHAVVLLLGDTGHPEWQRLTSDVMTKGLTLRAVHDSHDSLGGDEPAVLRLVLAMMADRRLDCSGLISHRFPARAAVEAYRLVTEQRSRTMGVAFSWDDFTDWTRPGGTV